MKDDIILAKGFLFKWTIDAVDNRCRTVALRERVDGRVTRRALVLQFGDQTPPPPPHFMTRKDDKRVGKGNLEM